MVTDRDKYFFDLQGFIVRRGVLTSAEVRELNDSLDAIPKLQPGQWYGGLHGHTYGTKDGINYQQIYEAGEPFERLIDHPSWIDHMRCFVGGEGTFDYKHGPLFIDENMANFREAGEAIGLHSGGNELIKRNQFRVVNQKFLNCQVNALIALTDIGPGDGATMVIPASHKQNFTHPDIAKHCMKPGGASGDNCEGAIEVFMQAGDVLIFTDAICHGSAKRTNPGFRRILVYRYGPSWGFFRHGYRPTRELLTRLTPQRRQIVWPHEPFQRTPNLKPGFNESYNSLEGPPMSTTGQGG
ncbi:MAG: phytanoyl-CoA dioxygenase family protein [Phycisphaeraceae bacterium]|nr:phytanoyl-CoA dioxygenase family protein [Phycisphaeraceae bacterium]